MYCYRNTYNRDALIVRCIVTPLINKGPDALDWQNLFRPSKILDKICLCQIVNLSSVGALIHSKIFVNHKFQSPVNKHHRLLAVRRKVTWDLKSSLTASIEYVALAYYCLCPSFFSSLNSFNSSRRSCYFYYASGGFSLFDRNVLVLEIILAGFGLQYSD